MTLDQSSYDFMDSVTQRTNFAGISQHAISTMPIDQIYSMMAQNWKKEKELFEWKCQKVLEENEQESKMLMKSTMVSEQAKNR